MSPTIPGQDVYLIDDPITTADAGATDRLFLLSGITGVPTSPTEFRKADSGVVALDTQLRKYFNAGGAVATVQAHGGAGPTIAEAVGKLAAGAPGQIVAPEVVTSADIVTVGTLGWESNKVYLANGPADLSDAAATTLAEAAIAGGTKGLRGAGFWVDTALAAPLTGSTPDKVPFALEVAGLIAKADRELQKPAQPAAGKYGRAETVLGVSDARSAARRTTLSEAGTQINCAAAYSDGSIRNYGFRTLADLEELPQWWDFSGSRVVMALRAGVAATNDDFAFEGIDGFGEALRRYESAIAARCAELKARKALWAYSVNVGESVNPVENLQQGILTSEIAIQVSPFAEHIITNISRRALTATI